MNDLPKGWQLSTVEDCIEILDNMRKPVSAKERASRDGDVPYYGATGQAGTIDDYLFDEELILLGEDGAPFFDKSKNVAYLVSGKSWVNNHAHVLRARGVTTNRFLLHYLNQFDYSNYVGGTTRLKLNQGNLKTIPFPLPPLGEQRRIVAKLDVLFGELETLKGRLANIPGLLKNFRQAILTQAVTGKLTAEWRKKYGGNSKEYVAELLEERKHLGKIPKNLREKDISNYRLSLPNEWGLEALGYVFEIVRGSSPRPKGDPKYFAVEQTDYHWIKIADFAKHSTNNTLLDTDEFLTYEGSLKSRPVNKKDLLIAASGVGSVGKSSKLGIKGFIYDGLMAIKNIGDECTKDFISYYLKQKEEELHQTSTGTSWLNINTEILNNYLFPIPSKREQEEIVRRVEGVFAQASAIEEKYKALKERITELPQAILAKAFRGELVEQLPTDGDAKELLEEIKKIKEQLALKKKSKRKIKK